MLLGDVGDARLYARAAQGVDQPLVAELPLVPGDPVVVAEFGEGDPGPVGQPVSGRDGDVDGVVQQVGPGQLGGHRHPLVVPVDRQRQVEVPAHDGGHALLGLLLTHQGPQFGMFGAQHGEDLGQQPAHGGREGADPQLADGTPPLGLDVGLGQLHLGNDPGRVIGEQPPGVGEPDPAPAPGQQRLADLPLQLGHLLGHGGGGDMEPVGGAADRTMAGEGVEGTQALQVQHVSNATSSPRESLACPTKLTRAQWGS